MHANLQSMLHALPVTGFPLGVESRDPGLRSLSAVRVFSPVQKASTCSDGHHQPRPRMFAEVHSPVTP